MNTTAVHAPLIVDERTPALSMRRRDEDTVALLWDELARTDPTMFALLWRKAHRPESQPVS